jgi:hypothetical protein
MTMLFVNAEEILKEKKSGLELLFLVILKKKFLLHFEYLIKSPGKEIFDSIIWLK